MLLHSFIYIKECFIIYIVISLQISRLRHVFAQFLDMTSSINKWFIHYDLQIESIISKSQLDSFRFTYIR